MCNTFFEKKIWKDRDLSRAGKTKLKCENCTLDNVTCDRPNVPYSTEDFTFLYKVFLFDMIEDSRCMNVCIAFLCISLCSYLIYFDSLQRLEEHPYKPGKI